MTANPTEVMTEHELAAVDRLMMSPEKTNVSSYTRKLLSSAFQKLRSSRNEADDSIRKFFKELCPDVGGPEKDCVQTLIAFAREWHGLWKAEEAKVARLEGERDEFRRRLVDEANASSRMFHIQFQEAVCLKTELSAARAEASRLSGELASRPAKELVEAATEALRIMESRYPKSLEPAIEPLRAALDSALSQASSADALSAPAKEGVAPHLQPYVRDVLGRKVREVWITWAKERPHPKASWLEPYDNLEECDKEADRMIGEELARHFALFGNPFSPAPVAGETRTCAICGQSGRDMRELTSTETFSTLLGTVGISAYAWVCKSHRSAPVAAPASAVSPASEEKDAKAQVGGIPSGTGVVAGLVMASTEGIAGVSPTPAPAPSDGAPGAAKKDHLQEQRKCYRCGAGVVDQAEMEEECFGCVRQDREELQQRVSELEGQLQSAQAKSIRLQRAVDVAIDALDAMKGGAT